MKATFDIQDEVITTLESNLGHLLPLEEMMVRELVSKLVLERVTSTFTLRYAERSTVTT